MRLKSSTPLRHSSLISEPYRDSPPSEILFNIMDREFAIVKDTCRKACICFPFYKTVVEMFKGTHTPAGDHRYTGSIGNGRGDGNIKAIFCAIGLHTREQDLTGTAFLGVPGPGNCINTGWFAAPVDDNFIPAG